MLVSCRRCVAVRTSCQFIFILFFVVVVVVVAALQSVKPVVSWVPTAQHFHNHKNNHFSQRSAGSRQSTRSLTTTILFTSTATTTTAESVPTLTQQDLKSNDSMVANELSTRAQTLFRGQTVLITGASSGLGRSLALELAGCGAHALVLSARNQDALNLVAQECQQAFDIANHQASLTKSATTPLVDQRLQVHVVPCDLSQPDDVAKLAAQALELCHGRIDVLVNNGGISSRSRFVDTQLAVDEQLMQVNFFSGAALAKAVVPGMIQRGFGKIIWVSSVQGLMGIPHRTSYAASKFAVQGYCEALRAELTSQGVGVHIASPGYIRTNLSKSAVTGDGTLHGQVDATTAKGAPPEQVARHILNHVAAGRAEFVVAATLSAKVAIWLRFLCPSLLRFMLVRRYEKTEKGKD